MSEFVTVVLDMVSANDAQIIFNSYKNGTPFFGCYVTRVVPGDEVSRLETEVMEVNQSLNEIPVEDSIEY